MQSNQAANDNGKTRARGRRDRNSGQEAVIEAGIVRDKLADLTELYIAQTKATDAYSEAIKACAESSGLLANVVSKYVKAMATDKAEAKKREAEQLCLLFEEA